MGNQKRGKYNDYRLINDNEMADVDFDFPTKKRSRCMCITITIFFVLSIVFLIVLFVILPVIFMSFKSLQTNLIFTHFNLPQDQKFFTTQRLTAYKNRYVTFNHSKNGKPETLGLWHILPVDLAYNNEFEKAVNFDAALLNSNYSVLIYFHGTGEARSDNIRKYELFAPYFHIIAFDYRGYADSSKGELSEQAVVDDCIELYKWVKNRTNSEIYVWGHSLGAALAAETVAVLENNNNITGKGLILESAFTNLRDELYVHPYTKIFAWLPWFKATILDPLMKNGFLFETDKHLSTITCPVMILHAQDDPEIPFQFGKKLSEIASKRNATSIYYEFDAKQEYAHNFIFTDPFMKLYLKRFIEMANNSIKIQ